MRSLFTMRVFVLGLFIAFMQSASGCRQEQQKTAAPPATPVAIEKKPVLLSVIAADERPHAVAGSQGHATGRQSTAVYHVQFAEQGRGVAYIARKGSAILVVHNGKQGRPYTDIDAYTLAISPDGRRVAYGARKGTVWSMVIDGREAGPYDEIGAPVFSPDSRHVAYEARSGAEWHIVIDGIQSSASSSYYRKPSFSGDSRNVLYVEKADAGRPLRVVISDLAFKDRQLKESSGVHLVMNVSRTRVAMSVDEGGRQKVAVFDLDSPDRMTENALYDSVHHLAISADGRAVCYVAERGGRRLLILNGREEQLPEGEIAGAPVPRPDGKSAGILIASPAGTYLYEGFTGGEKSELRYDEAADLTYSENGKWHAFAARRNNAWFVVVNGREGPSFDRVVAPLFSKDGRTLVYRARKEGRRFVVVADSDGGAVKQHPAYEQVFQPVFTDDGSAVAYGAKEGRQLVWKVEKLR